jgi:hypothetical protein
MRWFFWLQNPNRFRRAQMFRFTVFTAAAIAAALAWPAAIFGQAPDAATAASQEQFDVLTRAPLHEAFAEPYTDPVPGIIVDRATPEPINEIPPEYRPEGENIAWIAGYWGWDDELENFIWISGVWRETPPNQRWVPGYWARVDAGYQWISGFWAPVEMRELEYLPNPPEGVESGPSSPQPGDSYVWIPGHWVYAAGQYRWQAGYWAISEPGWVWVAARYVWTPTGCIYRPGYWDLPMATRGVVFAPVYFHDQVVVRTYRYTPSYVIDTGPSLLVHLFVNPRYNHYCYGNYYGLQRNVVPWITYGASHRRYDPLFAYYRWQATPADANVLTQVTRLHTYFTEHREMRPPVTFAAQQRFLEQHRSQPEIQRAVLGQSFQTFVRQVDQRDDRPRLQFQQIAERDREAIEQGSVRSMRQLGQQRLRFEAARGTEAATAAESGRPARRLDLPAADATASDRGSTEREPSAPPTDRPRPETPSPIARPDRPPADRGGRPDTAGRTGAAADRPDRGPPSQRDQGRRPDQPSVRPDQPSGRPGQPSVRPGQPSDRRDRPSDRRDQPSPRPDQPGTAVPGLDRPDVTPRNNLPEAPGAGSRGSRTPAVEPGQRPLTPDARRGGRPETPGRQPSERRDVPSVEPKAQRGTPPGPDQRSDRTPMATPPGRVPGETPSFDRGRPSGATDSDTRGPSNRGRAPMGPPRAFEPANTPSRDLPPAQGGRDNGRGPRGRSPEARPDQPPRIRGAEPGPAATAPGLSPAAKSNPSPQSGAPTAPRGGPRAERPTPDRPQAATPRVERPQPARAGNPERPQSGKGKGKGRD